MCNFGKLVDFRKFMHFILPDPKLRCSSLELLHQQQQQLADMSSEEVLKHPYLGFTMSSKHLPDSSSSTSPTSTSSSPHHHHHGGQRHHSVSHSHCYMLNLAVFIVNLVTYLCLQRRQISEFKWIMKFIKLMRLPNLWKNG